MNVAETRFSTIPCAASSTVPIQPTITALMLKSPLSASPVSPIGRPSRTTRTIAGTSGRQIRRNSP